MAYSINEFPLAKQRILVCEADSKEELDTLRAKALGKGWAFYAEGDAPLTQRFSVWLQKPNEPAATASTPTAP